MNQSSRDNHSNTEFPEIDLLGYVLGALDDAEKDHVESVIRSSPELAEQLEKIKSSLSPLGALEKVPATPPGLARRSCEMVASHIHLNEVNCEDVNANDVNANVEDGGVQLSEARWLPQRTSWRLVNVIAVAACILVLASLTFPVLHKIRNNSQLVACSNNLREVGFAMFGYADSHGGRYPGFSDDSNLAFAGSVAPLLLENELVEDESFFLCAGNSDDRVRRIPTIGELELAEDESLIDLQRIAGGDYAYPIGYFKKKEYVPPYRRHDSHWALLGDSPSTNAGRVSSNHGSRGQNVLLDDGHVRFLSENAIGSDAIYENDNGLVAPGNHEKDSVIAPSYIQLGY